MYREELNLPEDSKWSSVFTLIIGIAYLGVGIIQIFSSLQLITPIVGFSDLIGGFLLIITANNIQFHNFLQLLTLLLHSFDIFLLRSI